MENYLIIIAVCTLTAFAVSMVIMAKGKKSTLDLYKKELKKEEKESLRNITERSLFSEHYKKILQDEFAEAEVERMKKPLLHKGRAVCNVVHEETGICYAEEFLNRIKGYDLEIVDSRHTNANQIHIAIKDQDKLMPNVMWDECRLKWMDKNGKAVKL